MNANDPCYMQHLTPLDQFGAELYMRRGVKNAQIHTMLPTFEKQLL